MAQTVIDNFEYANDAAAQAAYVTNAAPGYGSDVTATMTDYAVPSPNVVADNVHYQTNYGWKCFDKVTSGWSVGCWYAYNTLPCYVTYDFGNGNAKTIAKYTLQCGIAGNNSLFCPTAWTLIGSNDNFVTPVTLDTQTGITWLGNAVKTFTFNNTTAYRYYKLNITATNGDYPIVVEMTMMEATAGALQCYSEGSIKTQGSYSLKAVAAITGSLNKTLTHTFGTSLNLSTIGMIRFDMRASRTGSNIKFGIVDTGGTTEYTPNITAANTWQTCEFDISGVADANKDAITSLVITVTNADADNTFYLDNMYYLIKSPDYAGVRNRRE